MPAIRHRRIRIGDLDVFVREAGDPARPTIVLLPGYPSSTRAYVRLIDRLAPPGDGGAIHCPGFRRSGPPRGTGPYVRLIDRLAPQWHVVAIDYPGFGSSEPLPGSPTFDRLADVT